MKDNINVLPEVTFQHAAMHNEITGQRLGLGRALESPSMSRLLVHKESDLPRPGGNTKTGPQFCSHKQGHGLGAVSLRGIWTLVFTLQVPGRIE